MADTKVIKTQADVVIDYGEVGKLQPRPVLFEMDDRLDAEQDTGGVVRIRKYPADDSAIPGSYQLNDTLNYQTTQGQIFFTNEVRYKDVFGRLTFTGSDRVKLPYPVIDSFTMFKVGRFFDLYGNLVNPILALDYQLGEIVCNQQIFGTIDYAYRTNYRILRYQPELYLGDEGRLIWGSSSYGALIATYRISFTIPVNTPVEPLPAIIFQIQPPEALNVEFELYRLESSVIVNEDGTWEKPPGWPTSGVYPTVSDPSLQLDPNEPSLELTRVHEIAHFTLQDFDSRAKDTGSKYNMNLPISFKHLEREKDVSAKGVMARVGDQIMSYWDKVEPRPEEYWRRVRDFRQPRMRITRYEQNLQKPFDTLTGRQYLDPTRYVLVRSPLATLVLPGNYRIKLKAVPGRKPVAESTARTITNRNDASQDLQAAVANAQLFRAWNAIDWQAIRRMIIASYHPQWYELDLTQLPVLG